jgi:cell division protein FtsB
MSSEARSRLCPEHRNDHIPTSSCVACAQARRIAELEQTVERLAEHVEALKSDAADAEETARESPPLPDGGER